MPFPTQEEVYAMCAEDYARKLVQCLEALQLVPLPSSYLVVDLETTGLKPYHDYITQLGYVRVVAGEITHKDAVLLQLPPGIEVAKKAALVTGISTNDCNSRGLPRREVLPVYLDSLNEAVKRDMFIVGHNIVSFDLPFLRRECELHNIPNLFSDYDKIIDTGIITKAIQLGDFSSKRPRDRMDYYRRISGIRSRVKWNLASRCPRMYDLEKRFPDVDFDKAHDAGADCVTVHYLIKTFKQMTEVPAHVA